MNFRDSKNILSDIKRWRFWRHFITYALAVGGGLSGFIQLSTIVIPGTQDWYQGYSVLGVIVFLSVLGGLWRSWPVPIEMTCQRPSTKISVVEGDLFQEPGNIVVGVCDTFDTSTPNIISRNTVLGKAIDRLFGGDSIALDRLIDGEVAGLPVVGNIAKPGKTTKYGVGTVVVIPHHPRLIFLSAYTEMNQINEAQGTVDAVWKTLLALWKEVSARGNHSPISIPVIGDGPSRMSQILPAQDSIRLIALSYMFASRERKISDELRIIVTPQVYKDLDRLELQAFLSSLRPS